MLLNHHRKRSFGPARLLSLLGEQLISDQAVGLIELVKNAYDADATAVSIELSGLRNPKTTRVIIQDNGCGMTRDDIEQKWLSPAVSHKERQKKSHQRTPLGRLPIGEKGVGRLAVQQLGHKLQLVSRAAHDTEIVVEINWDDFDRILAHDYRDRRKLSWKPTPAMQEAWPGIFGPARTKKKAH